jgi:probable F420-dependent oxidoreductase
MRYGVCLPHHRPLATPELIAQAARQIEALGFDGVWLSDHVTLPDTPAFQPRRVFYEPLALAGYLAASTSRVRIGFSVLVVPYRHPVVTAKQIATVDQMSGGRLVLGVGVGWVEEEFAVLSAPFHERGRRTDEYLRAMKELWTSEAPSFAGESVQFRDISFLPKPAQRPGPPLIVAGATPRAIRRAAELGDGWNPIRMPTTELTAGVQRFRAVCARAGRPDDLPVVYRTDVRLGEAPQSPHQPFTGTPDRIHEDVHAYTAAGVTEFVFDLAVSGIDSAEAWLEALNRLAAELRPAEAPTPGA